MDRKPAWERPRVGLGDPILKDIAKTLADLGLEQGEGDFLGLWKDRNRFNIPGPIYVGDDDDCGTGPLAAPNNVCLPGRTDEMHFLPEELGPYGGEFVFRQPSTMFELDQVVEAAATNAVGAYALDGDDYWTAQMVQEWWDAMHPFREASLRALERFDGDTRKDPRKMGRIWPTANFRRWIDWLDAGAESYLELYLAYLDRRRRG
jgi:hypothetical protein